MYRKDKKANYDDNHDDDDDGDDDNADDDNYGDNYIVASSALQVGSNVILEMCIPDRLER